jgi:hypothetical protein
MPEYSSFVKKCFIKLQTSKTSVDKISKHFKGILRVNTGLTTRKKKLKKLNSNENQSSNMSQQENQEKSETKDLSSKMSFEFGLVNVKHYLSQILKNFPIDYFNFNDNEIDKIKSKDAFDGKILFLLEKIYLRHLQSKENLNISAWSYKSFSDIFIVNKSLQFELIKKLQRHLEPFIYSNLEEWRLALTTIEQMFIDEHILQNLETDNNFGVFDIFE